MYRSVLRWVQRDQWREGIPGFTKQKTCVQGSIGWRPSKQKVGSRRRLNFRKKSSFQAFRATKPKPPGRDYFGSRPTNPRKFPKGNNLAQASYHFCPDSGAGSHITDLSLENPWGHGHDRRQVTFCGQEPIWSWEAIWALTSGFYPWPTPGYGPGGPTVQGLIHTWRKFKRKPFDAACVQCEHAHSRIQVPFVLRCSCVPGYPPPLSQIRQQSANCFQITPAVLVLVKLFSVVKSSSRSQLPITVHKYACTESCTTNKSHISQGCDVTWCRNEVVTCTFLATHFLAKASDVV